MTEDLKMWVAGFVLPTEMMFKEQGCIWPTAFVDHDGGVSVIKLDFQNSDTKDWSMEMIRFYISETNADRVLIISETWLTDIKPDDTKTLKRVERLGIEAAGVKRREAIMYRAEDRVTELVGQQEITRNAKGVGILSPFRINSDALWSGRISGLMPRDKSKLQ